ncbi:hypothetical protein DAH66_14090 [Sphingomonas koreensis]|uniref:Uncharacterized protein n=1 Tax=Sphingomonas koreensis TaxID=93064 RepID=A0A430G1N3_9SPHN|nr:hypothetical protein [Sphingomonas koreensis]RSY81996.1 hypothetical protein DAH66_14090 [Sphingomonas koreensis]
MPSNAFNRSSTPVAGGTLFERMRRTTQMPVVDVQVDVPRFLREPETGTRDLVVVEPTAPATDGAVRFTRGEVDGQPAVLMQERGADGRWTDGWSLPTDSVDAREGMIGWLNTQSHRWERFATMLRRRGPEELTRWVFELMVVPNTGHATAPRFEPQRWTTLQQYAAPSFRQSNRAERIIDDCACRPGSVQSTRDF